MENSITNIEPLYTTINILKESNANAYVDQYEYFRKHLPENVHPDEKIELSKILEVHSCDEKLRGVLPTLWVIYCAAYPKEDAYKFALHLSILFVKKVLYIWEREYPNNKHLHRALEAKQNYIDGKITREELAVYVHFYDDVSYVYDSVEVAWDNYVNDNTVGGIWTSSDAIFEARDQQYEILKQELQKLELKSN